MEGGGGWGVVGEDVLTIATCIESVDGWIIGLAVYTMFMILNISPVTIIDLSLLDSRGGGSWGERRI